MERLIINDRVVIVTNRQETVEIRRVMRYIASIIRGSDLEIRTNIHVMYMMDFLGLCYISASGEPMALEGRTRLEGYSAAGYGEAVRYQGNDVVGVSSQRLREVVRWWAGIGWDDEIKRAVRSWQWKLPPGAVEVFSILMSYLCRPGGATGPDLGVQGFLAQVYPRVYRVNRPKPKADLVRIGELVKRIADTRRVGVGVAKRVLGVRDAV